MQLDQPLDDRKAEAGAVMRAVVGGAHLEERIADVAQILLARCRRRCPRRRASHRRRRRSRRDRDLAAALGELDRVGEEIDQDLLHGALVGDDVGQVGRPQQTRSMPASRARSAIRSQHVPITGAGANGSGRDLEIAALDLRHVEDAVDDREQVMSGIRRSASRIRGGAPCRAASSPRSRASRRSR